MRPRLRPQFSSASRRTASQARFLLLTQSGERPLRRARSLRLEHCTRLGSDVTADQRRGVYILIAAAAVIIIAAMYKWLA